MSSDCQWSAIRCARQDNDTHWISPYLEVLHVLGSFMLPDPCKSLRIVESANFNWQGARTHSLNINWDAPAHNCESLPRYVVHV